MHKASLCDRAPPRRVQDFKIVAFKVRSSIQPGKGIFTLPELLGPASSSFPPNIVCPLRLEERGACILRWYTRRKFLMYTAKQKGSLHLLHTGFVGLWG